MYFHTDAHAKSAQPLSHNEEKCYQPSHNQFKDIVGLFIQCAKVTLARSLREAARLGPVKQLQLQRDSKVRPVK